MAGEIKIKKQPTIKVDHFDLHGLEDQKKFFKMLGLLEELTNYNSGIIMPPNNIFSGFKPRNYRGDPRSIRNVILKMILHRQRGDLLAAEKLAAGTKVHYAKNSKPQTKV